MASHSILATAYSMSTSEHRSLVFGPLRSRRVMAWQQALKKAGLPPADVICYQELYEAGSISEIMSDLDWQPQPSTMARLESPVNSSADVRFLIRAGAKHLGEPEPAWQHGRGLMRHPSLMLNGIETVTGMAAELNVNWLNAPSTIPVTCHKTRCSTYLSEQGVPVPNMVVGVTSFQQLLAHIQTQQWPVTFVKPAAGSTGNGVIELRWDEQSNELTAVTAMEAVVYRGIQMFRSNLGVREYRDQNEIAAMVEYLIATDDLQVEQAVNKPLIDSSTTECCDLRVITIGGKACHRMARVSAGPITNLHLGNRRAAPEDVLDAAQLNRSLELAEVAAAAFPDCLYLGVDVIPPNDDHQGCVLEVNIYGDLINEAIFEGMNPWEYELHTLQRKILAEIE